MMSEDSSKLPVTEQENPRTKNLSSLSSLEIVRLMNDEDALVATAVATVVPDVARAIDQIAARLKAGGRLFYVGTGTSGRLGVLDAAECPPTFGVSPELVQAIIAGGYQACYQAVEASEDDEKAGENDLRARGFNRGDALVGIAASGRTPYTIGALSLARKLGAFTVALTCVPGSLITTTADLSIVPVVGPEVLTGSSRLKAGTAQKMVLNMISTGTMVRLGYVSGNRMSNVHTRNSKLRDRAIRILMTEVNLSIEAATAALDKAEGNLSTAIVMLKTKRGRQEAEQALAQSNGVINDAVQNLGGQ